MSSTLVEIRRLLRRVVLAQWRRLLLLLLIAAELLSRSTGSRTSASLVTSGWGRFPTATAAASVLMSVLVGRVGESVVGRHHGGIVHDGVGAARTEAVRVEEGGRWWLRHLWHEQWDWYWYVYRAECVRARVYVAYWVVHAASCQHLLAHRIRSGGNLSSGFASIVRTAGNESLASAKHGVVHVTTARVQRVDELLGLAELDHAFFEVVQRSFDQYVLLFVVREQMVPQQLLGQHFRVANYYHSIFGSSESDIQTSWIVQETNTLMLISADTRQDNNVLLAALKSIDTSDLDLLVDLLVKRAAVLHVLDEIGALALIGRDDTDLVGLDTSFDELSHDFLDHRRLGTVQVRCTRA